MGSRPNNLQSSALPRPVDDVPSPPLFPGVAGVWVLPPFLGGHSSEDLLVPVTKEEQQVDDMMLQRASEYAEGRRVRVRTRESQGLGLLSWNISSPSKSGRLARI